MAGVFTTVSSLSQADLKVRFKETYVSEGLNRKFTGVVPRGVYRGFKLIPNGTDMTVTLEDDSDTSDHVAVYEDLNGRALTIHIQSGDIDIDLTASASTTVAIAIYVEYSINATTLGQIRTYEVSPADELTGATEEGELIILGTVIVPASGVIPVADITAQRRTSAGAEIAPEATSPLPLVANPHFNFDIAANKASTFTAVNLTSSEPTPLSPGWSLYGQSVYTTELTYTTTNALFGSHQLQVSATAIDEVDCTFAQDLHHHLDDPNDSLDIRVEYEIQQTGIADGDLATGEWLNIVLVFDGATGVLPIPSTTAAAGVHTYRRAIRPVDDAGITDSATLQAVAIIARAGAGATVGEVARIGLVQITRAAGLSLAGEAAALQRRSPFYGGSLELDTTGSAAPTLRATGRKYGAVATLTNTLGSIGSDGLAIVTTATGVPLRITNNHAFSGAAQLIVATTAGQGTAVEVTSTYTASSGNKAIVATLAGVGTVIEATSTATAGGVIGVDVTVEGSSADGVRIRHNGTSGSANKGVDAEIQGAGDAIHGRIENATGTGSGVTGIEAGGSDTNRAVEALALGSGTALYVRAASSQQRAMYIDPVADPDVTAVAGNITVDSAYDNNHFKVHDGVAWRNLQKGILLSCLSQYSQLAMESSGNFPASIVYSEFHDRWVGINQNSSPVYSNDGGLTWANGSGTFPSDAWGLATDEAGNFCANGCGDISISSDGIAWTASNATGHVDISEHMGWDKQNDEFVAIGNGGTRDVFTSTDSGANWTQRTALTGLDDVYDAAHDDINDVWVAVGESGAGDGSIVRNTDLDTAWTVQDTQVSDRYLSCAWGEIPAEGGGSSAGRFVAVGEDGNILWSDDGVSWAFPDTTIDNGSLLLSTIYSVHYVAGLGFYAFGRRVASDLDRYVQLYSRGGKVWQSQILGGVADAAAPDFRQAPMMAFDSRRGRLMYHPSGGDKYMIASVAAWDLG
jgi:hypothetical protein